MKRMNKRAISTIIGYVLLISLTLVMAGIVYSWLKFRISKPFTEESCPEGLSLIIDSYNCYYGAGGSKMINITFKNQGRFDIDQVLVRISNETAATTAIYPLFETKNQDGSLVEIPLIYLPFSNGTSSVLGPGEKQEKMFNYINYNKVTLIEIEPSKGADKYGRPILCSNAITKIDVQQCTI